MAPKIFRITRRIVIFVMICWLGNMLWKNHTTPHYETPAAPPKSGTEVTQASKTEATKTESTKTESSKIESPAVEAPTK